MKRIAAKLFEIARRLGEAGEDRTSDRLERLASRVIEDSKREAYVNELEALQRLLTIRMYALKEAVGDPCDFEELGEQIEAMMLRAFVENDANAMKLLDALKKWHPGDPSAKLVEYTDILGSWMLDNAFQEYLERHFGRRLEKVRTHEADLRLSPCEGTDRGYCSNRQWCEEQPGSSTSCPDFMDERTRREHLENPLLIEMKHHYRNDGEGPRIPAKSIPQSESRWPGYHLLYGDFGGFGDVRRHRGGWTGYQDLPREAVVSFYDLDPSLIAARGRPMTGHPEILGLPTSSLPDPTFEGEVESRDVQRFMQHNKERHRDVARRSLRRLLRDS